MIQLCFQKSFQVDVVNIDEEIINNDVLPPCGRSPSLSTVFNFQRGELVKAHFLPIFLANLNRFWNFNTAWHFTLVPAFVFWRLLPVASSS